MGVTVVMECLFIAMHSWHVVFLNTMFVKHPVYETEKNCFNYRSKKKQNVNNQPKHYLSCVSYCQSKENNRVYVLVVRI